MIKVIFVTFSLGADPFKERIKNSGIPMESIAIYELRGKTLDLVDLIRTNRPTMLVLNGKLHPQSLNGIYDDVIEVIHQFDMDCRIYSMEEKPYLRGTKHIENEEELKRIYESRAAS
jgi:hypothetical protein